MRRRVNLSLLICIAWRIPNYLWRIFENNFQTANLNIKFSDQGNSQRTKYNELSRIFLSIQWPFITQSFSNCHIPYFKWRQGRQHEFQRGGANHNLSQIDTFFSETLKMLTYNFCHFFNFDHKKVALNRFS